MQELVVNAGIKKAADNVELAAWNQNRKAKELMIKLYKTNRVINQDDFKQFR